MSRLDKSQIQRWDEGRVSDAYTFMGAHPNRQGTWFSVWAPHADLVQVVGDFNEWQPDRNSLDNVGAGLWQGYVRGARAGQRYKYRIGRHGSAWDKSDPYAFQMEPPEPSGDPVAGLASIITESSYSWRDGDWMASRKGPESLTEPVSIYELHLGSWLHVEHGRSLGYRDIAEPLANHVERLGFTHVEFMPLLEHPYYGSWGYQVVGYFAPTFRYGSPDDLRYLVDYLHQRGIGVLMDWVPAHFATDPQVLPDFDGTPLYEHPDPRMRRHPDWGTFVFDYSSRGVRNFLISSARYWIDEFHFDGLRFDAVASMLYLDYSRDEWTPNVFGGRENLDAIELLKAVNEEIYAHHPSVILIAEESTAWPGVSKPTYDGGLGFLYKWNMGWMHDTLEFVTKEPVHRKYHHHDLTFPFHYAFSEHYTLPLSHDEVVHGKGSLWGKMPGDDWQKAANLRLLYGHMVGSPGKKLLFMGGEFGQRSEWGHDRQIDWHLREDARHAGIEKWVADVFGLYRDHPSLHDDSPDGFEWIDYSDRDQSVVTYIRKGGGRRLLFVLNATPLPRSNYRIGVPSEGVWREVLNSDSNDYGGSGHGNYGRVESHPVPAHGRDQSIVLTLPPLSILILEKAC